MSVVAIHQPNFFPWLGYFDKIRRADAFVFLDDAQIQKTGGTWSNRVRIMVGGQANWLTAPIDRTYSGTRLVGEICFARGGNWRDRIQKTLQAAYGRAPFFRESMNLLEPILLNPDERLAEYNIAAVLVLCDALGLDRTKCCRSSSMPTSGAATDRLIELTRALGGTAYLCGGGASGYQDDAAFNAAGLELIHQEFRPQPYPQVGCSEFVPGLSVIDALMICGITGTAALLNGSR